MAVALPDRSAPSGPILVADHMERPALDNRSYRVIRLRNKLEALLIHDPDTDKVSAALDVNVGSFSDEDDMPGMAHAVEHLLFMGTKKFPKENAYNEYLTRNSGYSNAFTASCSTNYYFEISPFSAPSNSKPSSTNSSRTDLSNPTSPLYGALDRFAQFFVAPLFLEDTLDRELKAVDSENKKNLQSDTWRLYQLNRSLSNPKHPFCHFSTGNYKTLHDDPIKRGVQIRDEFIKFYETHYSANRMKLVVLGRESLDELEKWVQEFFSDVPNKDLPQNRWDDIPPYTENELLTQVFAKPVLDSRSVDIYFPYQDEDEMFESHPGRYITHLIGHEGPGSILAYLKAKGWANGLGSGSYSLCPGSAFLSISVRLTEDGLTHYQEVITTVFQYIAMINETPPQQWIFEELKRMSEVDFRFKQKSPASKTTSALSGTMQKPYPRDRLLSGPRLMRKWDPEAISKGLSYLRPDNFRIHVTSQHYPGNWDKKEKWYGTEYRYEKIPEEFLEEIRKAAKSTASERPEELHLPLQNEFIPTNLEVEKREVAEPLKTPKLIRNDEKARVWWKKDDRFWVPKANVRITLRSPLVTVTPHSGIVTQIYCELVNDALVEYAYNAEIAGLGYVFSSHRLGVDIKLSGYNDKMAVLLEKVLTSARDLEVKDTRFKIIKDRLTRGYRNWEFQTPYQQVGSFSRWLSDERSWINEQYEAELPLVEASDVRVFIPQLLSQMHVEVLAHGNLYKEDALKFTDLVEAILKPKRLPPAQWPVRRSLEFQPGSNFVYERPLRDPHVVNNCIEYILAIGSNTDRSLRAQLLLMAQIADEPAFDQLRTKEQLGYVVFSGATVHITRANYRVLIQSEKSPEYLETRIDSFLVGLGKMIDEMGEEEFESHKTSIINKRLESLKNLGEETTRFWNHVLSECYDFEQAQEDVTALTPLTKASIQAFFANYTHPSSRTRSKLAVHLLARTSPATIAEQITPEQQNVKLLELTSKFLSAQHLTVVDELLKKRFESVDTTSGDTEPLVKALEGYLLEDQKVPAEKATPIVEEARALLAGALPELGIEAKGPGDAASQTENGETENGMNEKTAEEAGKGNGTVPVKITDVHAWKASLQVSRGAQPVRPLVEFEETGAKL